MPTRTSPITVGRDAELALIDDARKRAADGRPAIVLVRGEAGIGKTRLVADAIDRAREAGSPILHGACLALAGEGLPYLPFVEAVRNFARTTPADRAIDVLGPARDELGLLIPEVAALASHGADSRPARSSGGRDDKDGDGDRLADGPDSTVDRARLFERVLGFLDRLAADAPLIAVIEDVQWVDPATHDLITFLVRNVTTERLVAILTCRTDDLVPGDPVLAWLAELGRAPGAVRIDLGRLGREDVERQLVAMNGAPLARDVARSIWQRSEGHPLFAEELLAAAADDTGAAPPPSLVEVLLSRVATLDATSLPIVRALAVAGRPIDERLLGPLVGRSTREVGDAIRDATARGVLVALPDGRHGFRHELLREIVERDLSLGERRELHEGFARELTAHPELADDGAAAATGELARHWAAADRPVEAHEAALAAAVAAEAVHAFGDAHRQLERAIALESRLPAVAAPSVMDRVAVRRRAATAADLAGHRDRAVELIREALALADGVVDSATAGVLHSRLAFLTWAGGDGTAALLEHERAVELVPAEPPSIARAAVLGALGGALMGLGRWADSRPVCEAAIRCAAEVGAVFEESRARTMLGSDLVALGEVDRGLDELRRAHELAGPAPTELWVVTGHNLGLNLLVADRIDEALVVATDTRSGARAGGLERRYGMELAALVADALFRLGRLDEADAVTTAGIALDQRGEGTPYLALVRARLEGRRGDFAKAGRRLAAIDAERLDADVAIFHAIVAAEVALDDGRPDAALASVESVIGPWLATGDVLWGVPLVTLGLRAAAESAEALRADRDGAGLAALQATVDILREHAAALAPRVVTPGTAAWLATAEAEARRHDGDVDPEPWRHAIAAWNAAIDPYEAAYARYRYAETELRRTGVRADVATELVAAWRTSVEIGAGALQRAIELLARRARVPLSGGAETARDVEAIAESDRAGRVASPPVPSPSHRLSAREIEVLRLVAAGRSNGEIGDELFITRKTAGVHVTHILDKLGVSNRVEAAMAAGRLGLLDADREPEPEPRLR